MHASQFADKTGLRKKCCQYLGTRDPDGRNFSYTRTERDSYFWKSTNAKRTQKEARRSLDINQFLEAEETFKTS